MAVKLRLGNAVFEAPASREVQAGACKLNVPKRELGNQFQNPVIPAWMPESSAMDGNIPIL